MRVLHLCSAYSQQELYQNLVNNLSSYLQQQYVYVPVRTIEELNKYPIVNDKVQIIYSWILRKYHRLCFNVKVKDVYKDLSKNINYSSFDLTHAHFLFSDGALALNVKKNYGIPYIVAVRNTDINIFFKFLPHLRKQGFEILREASAVIFLNPLYIKILFEKYLALLKIPKIQQKTKIIPNGPNNYWIENLIKSKKKDNDIIKLLYIGDFSPNKNVSGIIKALNIINKNKYTHLSIVGGGRDRGNKVSKQIRNYDPALITYYGRITEKNELKRIYGLNDIFIMPSFTETFGIVYLEAMSQGLPVIYSKGQGIDGYFKEGFVGYSVNPHSSKDIACKILTAYENFTPLSNNCTKEVLNFEWHKIVNQYINIYKEIIA